VTEYITGHDQSDRGVHVNINNQKYAAQQTNKPQQYFNVNLLLFRNNHDHMKCYLIVFLCFYISVHGHSVVSISRFIVR